MQPHPPQCIDASKGWADAAPLSGGGRMSSPLQHNTGEHCPDTSQTLRLQISLMPNAK
ncbi:hypothetical protein JYU34_006601 [Plutella xylostella]|uniref:Uncharacterized protein n=1 Tax=Plutella xylostella TaxID=51655 RepID=A0ABQ7QSF6_PLUXY|nr:hypothetical protein JYU34_006601 [Plutella xylostella]